jgi:hypothetical protein
VSSMARGERSTSFGGVVFALAFSLLWILVTGPVAADESSGTSGAPFLKIPIGANATVLPEIVAGMRPDASMLFSDPSDLSRVPSNEIFLTTASWLDQFNLSAASVALPVRSLGLTWSGGARLLYAGDVNGYDAAGLVVSQERYYDMAFSTGLGKRFDRLGLAVGGGVTYVREHLAVEDGNALTFSLGASYQRGAHRLQVAAQDLGGRLQFDDRSYDIDSRYIFGYGHLLNGAWGTVMLGAQATYASDGFERVDAGVCYGVNQYLSLMSGVGHATQSTSSGDVPIKAGLSIHAGQLSLDYAYSPQQYFSDTHTFSLRLSFGSPGPWGATNANGLSAAPSGAPNSIAPPSSGGATTSYLIVAGTHGSLESAEAEARALRLLKIPARAQNAGGRYRVVVDSYTSREDAAKALRSYRNHGHEFAIIVLGN